MNDCNELLELAAQGGIQFVRATEDGRYEVMSNSEARDLMEQNSHDVTILDGAEAEAINIFNARNPPQGQIPDDAIDNQIMVLDAGAPQKPLLVDDIEIYDDKDIRILDSKSFDERFAAEMAFFGGNKLNDFILGSKNMGFDSGISMINADDDGKSLNLFFDETARDTEKIIHTFLVKDKISCKKCLLSFFRIFNP